MSGSVLLVIVGPTGAGKTLLGIDLAERLGGEIISADAFAVYRGMDIGTAKPGLDERRGIPHHLVDIADPRGRYSAGEFVRDADAAIDGILSRGRQPVVVGGTHFYVRALLWGLFPEPPKDQGVRAELETLWRHDASLLRRELERSDPEAATAIAPTDRQRTLRALEVVRVSGEPITRLWRRHALARPRYPFRMFGIETSRPDLHDRISARVKNMFSRGLVGEVTRLLEAGVSAEAHAFKAIGYRESVRVVYGDWTEQEAQHHTERATRQLAKRQLTWLRRERDLTWISGPSGSWADRVVGTVEG